MCLISPEVARRLRALAILLGLPYTVLARQASEHPLLALSDPVGIEAQCGKVAIALGMPLKPVARSMALGASHMMVAKPDQIVTRLGRV